MELRIYEKAPGREAVGRRARRWRAWRPGWLGEFERWAGPAAEPERAAEQERSLVPVAVLLGLALLGQVAQYGIPEVRAYLEQGNVDYRASWIGFTLLKQWALFLLMLVALRTKEERLESVGFPPMDFRRLTLGFLLVVFSLGAALLHRPDAMDYWLVPYWPGERALWVVLAGTAAVVEESFFRGFAIVWLYRWSGHLPLAVVFPALIFAAGHGYLGWANVLVAFGLALGFSGLFLWRRDLYWPMVLHFLINVRGLVVV
ncbi:CPBP family intramembrane metalloprotease [Acidobacteriia bacterium AH_259_A11_L15]|nr:CPBP family intramembrane metalloprotease [Acidobacteriia bacterium AH_259_A11_L15]